MKLCKKCGFEKNGVLCECNNRRRDTRPEDRGLHQRTEDSKEVFRRTRDSRAAIREYCRGNKWLEENAKAVGNW